LQLIKYLNKIYPEKRLYYVGRQPILAMSEPLALNLHLTSEENLLSFKFTLLSCLGKILAELLL